MNNTNMNNINSHNINNLPDPQINSQLFQVQLTEFEKTHNKKFQNVCSILQQVLQVQYSEEVESFLFAIQFHYLSKEDLHTIYTTTQIRNLIIQCQRNISYVCECQNQFHNILNIDLSKILDFHLS